VSAPVNPDAPTGIPGPVNGPPSNNCPAVGAGTESGGLIIALETPDNCPTPTPQPAPPPVINNTPRPPISCSGLTLAVSAGGYAGFMGSLGVGGQSTAYLYFPFSEPERGEGGLAFTGGVPQSIPWPPFASGTISAGVSTMHPAGTSQSWTLVLWAVSFTRTTEIGGSGGSGFALSFAPSWPLFWVYHTFDSTSTLGTQGLNGGPCVPNTR